MFLRALTARLVITLANLTYVAGDERHGYLAMMEDRTEPEWPHRAPEIIPPDRSGREAPWRQQHSWRRYDSSQAGGTQRVFVARLGPIGTALLVLVIGVLAALVLLAVLGAILIWIPIFALLVAVGAIIRVMHR